MHTVINSRTRLCTENVGTGLVFIQYHYCWFFCVFFFVDIVFLSFLCLSPFVSTSLLFPSISGICSKSARAGLNTGQDLELRVGIQRAVRL